MITTILSHLNFKFSLFGFCLMLVFQACSGQNDTTVLSIEDDENAYTKAVKPLYEMTVNWLEVVQPSERGSVLEQFHFKGEFKLSDTFHSRSNVQLFIPFCILFCITEK